jgi:hypothetical protein
MLRGAGSETDEAQGEREMKRNLRAAVAASVVLATIPSGGTAFARKPGGILRTSDPDGPGGLSIQEEATSSPEDR